MDIAIYTPGKLSVPGTAEGVREYVRRISDWSLRHEQGLPGDPNGGEARVGLDVDGKMTTTEGLHKWLNGRAGGNVDQVSFLIGGKNGLSSKQRSTCDWTWSLGPLVMNQSIAALVVAEQCYRSFCLRTGHPYHES